MQLVRSTTRRAVSLALGASRMPIDLVSRLLPDGDGSPRSRVVEVVDRADAGLRRAIGTAVGDAELQADGRRRQIALTERRHAADLRLEAGRRRERADEQATAAMADAEGRRTAARQQAAEEEEAAEQLEAERTAAQEHAAEVREAEVESERTAKVQKAEKRAKRARLEVLDDEAEALDRRTDALAASDEAERLASAAQTAKAARQQR